MALIDIDKFAGNSLDHQRESGAGPLTAAMRTETLEIKANGEVTLPAGAYEPLLQIAPLEDLGDETYEVQIAQVAPAPAGPRASVRFAPFSEKDGFLPYASPAVGGDNTLLNALVLRIRVRRNGTLLPFAQTRERLHVRYSEGRFAKLLAVAQVETIRTRRLGREITARRTTSLARGFQLDRIGRELAVPRFDNQLTNRGQEIVLRPQDEADAAFARRLDIYRPFVMPTRARVLELLNGDDSPLRRLGAPNTFDILEEDNPFMVGFKVFGVGNGAAQGEAMRLNYLDHLKRTTWIDPGQNTPSARKLGQDARREQNAMRTRIRQSFTFSSTSKRNMAPWLARAFDRAGMLIKFLGANLRPEVIRAQDAAGGSRFELGLAAEIKALTASQVGDLRNRIQNAPKSDNPTVQGMLDTLRAKNLSDSKGLWFWEACGFRTATPLTNQRVLLSHVSMGTLTMEGPDGLDRVDARKGTEFSARILSGGSTLDAALANALAGGASGWPAGVADWSVVTPAQQNATLAGAAFADLPQADLFEKMGFAKLANYDGFVSSLRRYPPHAVRVLKIGSQLEQRLGANNASAADMLSLIADTLGSNGASSLALMKTNAGLVFVVASIGLPQVGTNIGPRRSSDFFWGGTTIAGGDITVQGQGTRTFVRALGDGVYAASTLAYSRIGKTDPFEWRLTLPRDAVLKLPQYEMLMNMLERMFPIGVEINTWDIRRNNVAVQGNTPQPLSPKLSRSYRPFRRPRFQGSGDAPTLKKTR